MPPSFIEVYMFGHVTVGTKDLKRAGCFYDAVLGDLGHARAFERKTLICYGHRSGSRFFVMLPFDGNAASVGNGTHIAFDAASRVVVDDFHSMALASGGTDEGLPGLRKHYHDHYYGAYVRDPDGNKLQAVCHKLE